MSTPINHHYVSRCQSKNFFNVTKGKIYILEKGSGKIFSKQTTKSLFSEDDSNTRATDDLSIDRISLEKDLKDNFEDGFERHFKNVLLAIGAPANPPNDLRESLIALTKFGIIGEVRNPGIKRKNDDVIAGVLFDQIMPFAAPELEVQLLELKNRIDSTKYTNSIVYSDFADQVFSAMGDVCCLIQSIQCGKFFLLPDTSAIRAREKINSYFNPDIKEIAMIGLPLSSKVFLHSQSVKLGAHKDAVAFLNEGFPGEIDRINFALYDHSLKQVACEDYDFLVKFRDNLEAIKEYSIKPASERLKL